MFYWNTELVKSKIFPIQLLSNDLIKRELTVPEELLNFYHSVFNFKQNRIKLINRYVPCINYQLEELETKVTYNLVET